MRSFARLTQATRMQVPAFAHECQIFGNCFAWNHGSNNFVFPADPNAGFGIWLVSYLTFTVNFSMMKSFIFTFLVFSSLCQANAQTFKTAVEYNDYIVEQQTLIGEKLMTFFERFGEEDMSNAVISTILDDLLNTVNDGVLAIKRLPAYEDDTQMRQAALELFQFYSKTIDQDYREMVNLVFGGNLDDATAARFKEIVAKVQAEEVEYDLNFSSAQGAFAEKYDFTLEENELQEKMGND